VQSLGVDSVRFGEDGTFAMLNVFALQPLGKKKTRFNPLVGGFRPAHGRTCSRPRVLSLDPILLHGNDFVAVSGPANTNLFLLNKVARGTLQKRDSAVFNVCLHRVFFLVLPAIVFDQLTGDVSTLSRKRFLFRKEEEVRKEKRVPAWSEAFRLNETHEFVI
jgi:hypothetical protein